MREAVRQSLENLRANKLRSVLTMFGILWGIVSIVVLSAMGEGFRRGNDQVLREFGRNIGIVWGGRTSLQAGGERAGRVVRLNVDDARAIERAVAARRAAQPGDQPRQRPGEEPLQRGVGHRPRGRAAVPGHSDDRAAVRPSAQLARRKQNRGASPSSAGRWRKQLFGDRHPIGEPLIIDGVTLHHRRPDAAQGPGQQLQRSRQQQDLRAVRGDGAHASRARRASRARCRSSSCRRATRSSTRCRQCSRAGPGRVADIDWPLEQEIREHPRAAQGLRSRGQGSHLHVGHGDAVAVLRSHRDLDEAVLHGRRASSRSRSAASA